MMNIIDQVSCKFALHKKKNLLALLSSSCYCHHQGSFIYIYGDCEEKKRARPNNKPALYNVMLHKKTHRKEGK